MIDCTIFHATPSQATLALEQVEDYSEQLRSQFARNPVLIHSFRFEPAVAYDGARFPPGGNTREGDPTFPLSVDIRVNNRAITQGFVPIATLLPSARSGATDSAIGLNSWRLHKPLYLDPSDHLSVRVKCARSSAGAWDPIPTDTPYLALIGRRVAKPPARRYWPWISNFTSTRVANSAAGQLIQERTTEANLVMNEEKPAFLHRFCAAYEGVWDQRYTFMRASDAYQQILIRNPVALANVMSATNNVWNVNTIIDPRNFFRFIFERDFRGAYDVGPTLHAFSVSMHTYYEVRA